LNEKEYEQFIRSGAEAIKSAVAKAQTKYEDFRQTFVSGYNDLKEVLYFIFGAVMWVARGPYGTYSGAIRLNKMFFQMIDQGFRINIIFMLLLFLFSCFITTIGLYWVHRKPR
jgi:hypothetical protein